MRRFAESPAGPQNRGGRPVDSEAERREGRHLPAGADLSDVARMGMTLFLGSLTMLFGATLVAFIIIRVKQGADWGRTPGALELAGLGAATALLLALDVLSVRARKSAPERLVARRLTKITVALAVGYMALQAINWGVLVVTVEPAQNALLDMEGFLFVMLTATHAVHVLGGVIAAGIVLARSKNEGPRPESLELLRRYWRYLTVVWFVLLGVLLFV